jgi:hypothetical protein
MILAQAKVSRCPFLVISVSICSCGREFVVDVAVTFATGYRVTTTIVKLENRIHKFCFALAVCVRCCIIILRFTLVYFQSDFLVLCHLFCTAVVVATQQQN